MGILWPVGEPVFRERCMARRGGSRASRSLDGHHSDRWGVEMRPVFFGTQNGAPSRNGHSGDYSPNRWHLSLVHGNKSTAVVEPVRFATGSDFWPRSRIIVGWHPAKPGEDFRTVSQRRQ